MKKMIVTFNVLDNIYPLKRPANLIIISLFYQGLPFIMDSEVEVFTDNNTMLNSILNSSAINGFTPACRNTQSIFSHALKAATTWGQRVVVLGVTSREKRVRERCNHLLLPFISNLIAKAHSISILGITNVQKLNWTSHKNTVAKSTDQRLGILLQTIYLLTPPNYFTTYKSCHECDGIIFTSG